MHAPNNMFGHVWCYFGRYHFCAHLVFFSANTLKCTAEVQFKKRRRETSTESPEAEEPKGKKQLKEEIEHVILERILQHQKKAALAVDKEEEQAEEAILDKLYKRLEFHYTFISSIVLYIKFKGRRALEDIWLLNRAGSLSQLFQNEYVTQDLLDYFNLEYLNIQVTIDEEDYLSYRKQLLLSQSGIMPLFTCYAPRLRQNARSLVL